MVSNRISLNRSLRDIRHPNCRTRKYHTILPTTSIIVPFHNEGMTTLLRTIHAIINRTPPSLLTPFFMRTGRRFFTWPWNSDIYIVGRYNSSSQDFWANFTYFFLSQNFSEKFGNMAKNWGKLAKNWWIGLTYQGTNFRVTEPHSQLQLISNKKPNFQGRSLIFFFNNFPNRSLDFYIPKRRQL